ncbi:unnamed protein product [Periconia digitata]|uniref:NmrA-like domain-containing protein n=1 Tax=Periconia digitata TaxID=1303443 RepID=A0A9W4UQ10_9PLEO|nr:unnamed protein product [Periconia digitata]
MSPKTALVIRATGAQGKGTVKALISTGWTVHALVGDASSDRAQALKKFGDGVILHQGTIDDAVSLETAAKGCSAAFLTQMPDLQREDAVAHEAQQASTFLQVAKSVGVKHVVLSTQIALTDPALASNKAWTESALRPSVVGKIEAEKLVRESGIDWTILRPGWFMTNLLPPLLHYFAPGIEQGKLVVSYQADKHLGAVDPDDIGAFAAAAFNAPEKFTGKHIPLLSEVLTTSEVFGQFIRATGKSLKMEYRTEEENMAKAKTDPFILGETLTHGLEKLATMEEMRSWGVHLTPLSEFLKKHKEEVAAI